MLIVLTEPSQIFVDKYNSARKAMDENIKFAIQLINFPKEPLEVQLRVLNDMHESLYSMLSLLRPLKTS